jgi:hypothetical protein
VLGCVSEQLLNDAPDLPLSKLAEVIDESFGAGQPLNSSVFIEDADRVDPAVSTRDSVSTDSRECRSLTAAAAPAGTSWAALTAFGLSRSWVSSAPDCRLRRDNRWPSWSWISWAMRSRSSRRDSSSPSLALVAVAAFIAAGLIISIGSGLWRRTQRATTSLTRERDVAQATNAKLGDEPKRPSGQQCQGRLLGTREF